MQGGWMRQAGGRLEKLEADWKLAGGMPEGGWKQAGGWLEAGWREVGGRLGAGGRLEAGRRQAGQAGGSLEAAWAG